MAPSNVEATVLILDAGLTASIKPKDGSSFFEKARSCICRIIERKIFSRPKDLIGIIVMNSDESNLHGDSACENISVFSELAEPTWDLIENMVEKIKSSRHKANWMGALKVGARFMEDIQKVNHKKIVLMSDLKVCPKNDQINIDMLTQLYKEKNLELIVIGPDIWNDEECLEARVDEEQEKSENLLKTMTTDLDAIICSFEDAIEQLLFHKRKSTKPMPWNVDLCIGSKIAIPVSGYGKIRDDKTVGQWRKCYKNPTDDDFSTGNLSSKRNYFLKEDNTAYVDELDIVRGYLYGQTIIPFTKMDAEMEYKSGSKCLIVFGFTDKSNINWNNLTGDGITYVVARKDDDNAMVALDAFIKTLNDLELVAIARKVYNNNGAPHMNVLIPIIEENYKCLSMINLAFKEDYRHIVFPSLDKEKYRANSEQIQAVDDLIEASNLSQIFEGEKEYFSVENSVNPTIQNFFDTLSYRALHPNEPLPQPRPEVQELLQIPEPFIKMMREPLESIKKNFDLIVHEKVKTGKYWVGQHLKQEDNQENNPDDKPVENNPAPSKTNVTAGSVMASQTTRVGTIQPSDDFKELISQGEPLEIVSDQIIEVIERLVFQTLGSNYNKPLLALKSLREECVIQNPSIFNNWIIQLKTVLLERSKMDFLNIIIDQKLGLISKEENSDSTATDNNIVSFYEIKSNPTSGAVDDMDTTDIDNLFD